VSERDPDPRFGLANERTLLAYQRTSVGLVAASIAVIHFFGDSTTVAVLAVGLLVCAGVAGAGGYSRYRHVEAAIRDGRPPPPSYAAHILSVTTLVCIAIAAIYVLVRVD
jgi:putative membrane protein